MCGCPGESRSVCLCLRGWAVVSWVSSDAYVYLVLPHVYGLRPADTRKPGAPVTAGSLYSLLLWLASVLCFIPRTQTPVEAEKSFYLRLLQLHTLFCSFSHNQPLPPLLSSSYWLPRYSCLSLSLYLSLSLSAVSEQLSMPQTHKRTHS